MVYSDSVSCLDMNQDLVFFYDAALSYLVAMTLKNCSSNSIIKMLLWGLPQKLVLQSSSRASDLFEDVACVASLESGATRSK